MSSVEAYKKGLKRFGYNEEAVEAMAPATQEQQEAELVQAVRNGANKSVSLQSEEDKPVDKAELRKRMIEKIGNTPSRKRARYNPDYTLTDEYKKMVEAGESTVVYQKYGTYTDKRRQEEIDYSLEIPLSESVKLRDSLEAEICKLENDMDNFSTKEAQDRIEQITAEFKQRARGMGANARATLQSEYDKACDNAELELYIKPRNLLAIQRAEAIERYKVYENRIKLYVSANREAIESRLTEARNREIDENLLALAEYVEG